MKKIFLLGILLISILTANAQVNPRSTYVNGYYKTNGTYVDSYNRTTPNKTINDNYSTYPNVNPYTGKQGSIKPDYYSTPKYNNSIYSAPTYSTKRTSSSKLFDY